MLAVGDFFCGRFALFFRGGEVSFVAGGACFGDGAALAEGVGELPQFGVIWVIVRIIIVSFIMFVYFFIFFFIFFFGNLVVM